MDEVSLIPIAQFADKVQMKIDGKELKDYMDADVYKYWQTYVIEQIDEYLKREEVATV